MALLLPDPADLRGPAALGGATLRLDIGGAESNVAVYLARTGHRVAWHSAVGDDAFGRHVVGRLTAEGVHCVVRTDPERPTGLYAKESGPEGTRVRYYRRGSAASALNRRDAARIWADRPRLVHTTGITAAISDTGRGLVEELLTGAPPGTLRSFDVNHRPALHGASDAEVLLSAARRADVVFCGLDEARALWGATTVEEARALLSGPELVVIKQGPQGATAFRGDRRWYRPAPEVDVVEPVGAGDAFAAGVLRGLLSKAPIGNCLTEGARLAGTVLRVRGDIPPRAGTEPERPGAAPGRERCETTGVRSAHPDD
ncbi:sugar kinase [Spinactinospora alkalitolerans]